MCRIKCFLKNVGELFWCWWIDYCVLWERLNKNFMDNRCCFKSFIYGKLREE